MKKGTERLNGPRKAAIAKAAGVRKSKRNETQNEGVGAKPRPKKKHLSSTVTQAFVTCKNGSLRSRLFIFFMQKKSQDDVLEAFCAALKKTPLGRRHASSLGLRRAAPTAPRENSTPN